MPVVNRGSAPGDPNADTAYDAFGKANDKFDATDLAVDALVTALGGKADAATVTAELALKANAAALANLVTGPASSVDNAVARFDLATGKLLQGSALLVADTTGALSRSGGGGVPVQGTNTNNAATVGDVGERRSSVIASGSAVALTTNVGANIASLSLPAGDWDVWANARFTGGATTTVTVLGASLSLVSATLDGTADRISQSFHNGEAPFGTTNIGLQIVPVRFSLAATTVIYLVAQCSFGVSTMSAFGALQARRGR